jgi:hypothetical protein
MKSISDMIIKKEKGPFGSLLLYNSIFQNTLIALSNLKVTEISAISDEE